MNVTKNIFKMFVLGAFQNNLKAYCITSIRPSASVYSSTANSTIIWEHSGWNFQEKRKLHF